jgi:hypothetical protein
MMYAEFVACYEATGQIEWFKNFVPGLRVVDNIEKSLKIYCENEPLVQYSYNNKKVMLSSTLILSIILLRRKSKIIPLLLST